MMKTKNGLTRNKQGFTLLELLIVIGIIAILSVILILVLNPAETLKKSRDVQRISDLNTLKTAIGIYTTSTSSPKLAGSDNTACKADGGAYAAGDKIYYSYPSDTPGAAITDTLLDGSVVANEPADSQVVDANLALTDGTGWLPINLDALPSGSPISNLPIDPVNTIAAPATVAATDLVYRYACRADNLTYEIDATLESSAFTSEEDKRKKDGGNATLYYEVGTNLKILGSGASVPF